MAGNGPKSEDSERNGGGNPTTEHHDIALAIEALRQNYGSAQGNRANHDQKTLFWARIAGIGVSIYTVLTLAVVGASIYSAKQAKIAADAAQSSAATAVDTEHRQLRAYVYVTPGSIKNLGTAEHPEGKATVSMIGQTPAYNLKFVTSIATLPYPYVGDIEKESPKLSEITQSILFPGLHFSNSVQLAYVPTADQVQILTAGKTYRFYIWGNVTYSDAFGFPRHVLFCFNYNGTPFAGDSAEICNQHVEAD